MNEERKLDENSSAVQSHLNIIQNIIQRMASNSALCKGWSVTLVSAILVVVADQKEPSYAFIAIMPIALFLALDVYYLALEKAFRKSYNNFIDKLHSEKIATTDVYAVEPSGNIAFLSAKAIGSFAVWPFYALLIITVILARYIILAN